MTLQDILNSNLSDKHKLELITFMQKGGLTPDQEEPKKSENNKTITPVETITIGDQEYDVAIADTPESRQQGLEPYGYLKSDEGMLFIFEQEVQDPFTMANCAIDLDIIFIDDEGEVVDVKSVQAYDEEPVTSKYPYMYVLEVNINSGIKEGDELDAEEGDFNDEDKESLKNNRMLILDSEGNVQAKIQGGERIFSRISTKRMIKAALKAYKTDADVDYRRVGRIVLKELDAQDSRENEYVSLPE